MPWPFPALGEVAVYELGWLVKGVATTERQFYNYKLWLELIHDRSNSKNILLSAKFILTLITHIHSWSISIQTSRNPFQDQAELLWELMTYFLCSIIAVFYCENSGSSPPFQITQWIWSNSMISISVFSYKNIQSQNFNVYLNMLGTKPGLDFFIFTF